MAKRIVSVIALLLMVNMLFAQSDPLTQARAFTGKKEYDKAAEVYKKLYEQNPADNDVYNEYLELLLQTKNYKEAEKIVEIQKSGKPTGLCLL